MFWVAVAVAVCVLVAWCGLWPGALPGLRLRRRAPRLETILFVDGPLAGRTDHLRAGPDGLPPHQFCAVVARPGNEGGDYTLPYERGPISETRHAWHYTQGWTTAEVADPDRVDQLRRRG